MTKEESENLYQQIAAKLPRFPSDEELDKITDRFRIVKDQVGYSEELTERTALGNYLTLVRYKRLLINCIIEE